MPEVTPRFKAPRESTSGISSGMVEKTCAMCSVRFKTHPCRIGKFCSVQCAGAARRKKKGAVCKNCGATFEYAPSQLKIYKNAGSYCSRKCSYAGQRALNAAKPVTDRYGRSSRSADKAWQLAVRERDSYTCQRCGKVDRYIHTHHVATRAQRPDLKHDVSNGKCLCGPCHQWTHNNPIQAGQLGLLSDVRYELARKLEKNRNIASAKRKGLDQAPEIIRLRLTGMYPQAIADQLGLGTASVRRIIKEAGIPSFPSGRPS